MQIIPLVEFCSVSPQLLSARAFSLLSVDCELIIAINASCVGAFGDIGSWGLGLGARDKGIGEKVLRHDYQ